MENRLRTLRSNVPTPRSYLPPPTARSAGRRSLTGRPPRRPWINSGPSRHRPGRGRVDLLEYQGKQLFARFGLPVSEGAPAATAAEARAVAEQLGGAGGVEAPALVGGV